MIMSSGRDVMMDNWSNQVAQAEKHIQKTQEPLIHKSQYQRMIEYRQILVTELERIDNYIKELQQNEQ